MPAPPDVVRRMASLKVDTSLCKYSSVRRAADSEEEYNEGEEPPKTWTICWTDTSVNHERVAALGITIPGVTGGAGVGVGGFRAPPSAQRGAGEQRGASRSEVPARLSLRAAVPCFSYVVTRSRPFLMFSLIQDLFLCFHSFKASHNPHTERLSLRTPRGG